MLKTFILCLFMVSTLVACDTVPRSVLAPVQVHGVEAFSSSDLVTTVRSGDTLSEIAARYSLSEDEIAYANALPAPYRLYKGQRLRIPRPAFHTVRTGQTITQIANHYNLSPQFMVKLNRLQPPYQIYDGQKLALRDPQAAAPEIPYRIAQSGRIIKVPYPRPKPLINAAPTPQWQAPVQTQTAQLRSPVTPQPVYNTPEPAYVAPSQVDSSALNNLLGSARERFGNTPQDAAGDDRAKATRTGRYAFKTGEKSPRFAKPLQGLTLSEFGKNKDGSRNDGINIAAPRGTAVRAAAGGEVVYSDDEIAGYGNLVLLKHGGGWMTAYAHLDKRLVTRGEWLEAGQSLGTVGKTGSVTRPQLHFEVRRDAKAVNPERYF